jgi:predicted ATPase
LNELILDQDVTVFIGENGSGKTTLLESIASLARVPNILPESDNKTQLSGQFKLIWTYKALRGYYLKSQSFITYINNLSKIKRETELEFEEVKKRFSGKALSMASQPYARTLSEMNDKYGKGLDKMSHGESYLELFKSRLVPDGLYLLDEPELSLSPTRQLGLIALIKEMIDKNCQFIIITHSPILMAIEGAVIYNFEEDIFSIDYEDIEHVKITRDFLNNPELFLRHL